MTNREAEWMHFAGMVKEHIAKYTVPQYGDSPHDEVMNWTPEQCIKAVSKYVRRFESGQRGASETLRDMMKIAHFACITYFKLCECYGVTPPPIHRKDLDDVKQSD